MLITFIQRISIPFSILLSALQEAKKQWELEIESIFFFFKRVCIFFLLENFPRHCISSPAEFISRNVRKFPPKKMLSFPDLLPLGYPLRGTFRFQIDPRSFTFLQISIELCNATFLMNLLPELMEIETTFSILLKSIRFKNRDISGVLM